MPDMGTVAGLDNLLNERVATFINPYNDNNVRMALKLAVNREELVKQILRGYGEPGNDHPIAPVNKYHAKDLERRKFDPEKAKFYMKKAGMLDHTFNLHAADAAFAGAVDAAVLMEEQAKKQAST